MTTFHEFLRNRCQQGGFTTEDTLASFLPLVRQVIETHERGKCAPLEGLGALQVEGVRIWFDDSLQVDSRKNLSRVRQRLRPEATAVVILNEAQIVHDVDSGLDEVKSTQSADVADELERPAWLTGYVCWEHKLEHHDPLTDVFSLGLILVSLTCGLDLTESEDHQLFVKHRNNLFELTPGLHPVLAKAIGSMTELDRHKRPQDLQSLLKALENYRDQDIDFDTDLARNRKFEESDRPGKRQIILEKLQERLFEISRRNRLLHFKPTMQSVNLTQASIPLMFDYKNVREDQILCWKGPFRRDVLAEKAVPLNKYLNFREAIYLPGTLDRIISEGARDEKEYGFAQLRLVICFLRWANLKEKPIERYESPLLLLPVKLAVKKGIHDRYSLTALETEAEVNPVIRHLFKQLYDIELPEFVEATESGLNEFHANLDKQIQVSDSSVTLTKVDKPRIDLIHEKAKRRLDQFRRRARLSGRGIRHFLELDYSYDPVNYHPLGVLIFEEFVRPAKTHLERVVSKGPPRPHYMVEPEEPPVAEAEQTFFQVRDQADENPFHWEFDLCNVTLANLKYRRMSLVRDYRELAEDTTENRAFEATFSIAPRDLSTELMEPTPLADRYHVVACDPTQTNAISIAQSGASYIIQGPPGTGKSQTITNLIADYVVRGKRVLFVCEKRAAIDVVYHRLKQRGLHELCCLIHDSQSDKKEFVMDLKETYESYCAGASQKRNRHAARRTKLLQQIERELQPLVDFDAAMRSIPAQCSVPLRSLLNRRIQLTDHVPELSLLEWERIPHYREWHQNREQLKELASSLREVQADGILSHHPLHLLSEQVSTAERPLELVSRCLQSCSARMEHILSQIKGLKLPFDLPETLTLFEMTVNYASQAAFLADAQAMHILQDQSESSRRLKRDLKQVRKCDEELTKKRKATAAWREKLPLEDAEIALEQARRLEGGLFSVFKPGWWRLRGVLRRAYDFSRHKVRPSWVRILDQLLDEYQARAKRNELTTSICESIGIEDDFEQFASQLSVLEKTIKLLPQSLQAFHDYVIGTDRGNEIVLTFAALANDLSRLKAELAEFLEDYQQISILLLNEELRVIEDSLDELPDYLHCLEQLGRVSDGLSESLRTLPLTLPGLEAATAEQSVQTVRRDDRATLRFDGIARRRHTTRLKILIHEWQKLNAECVRERVRQEFAENVNLSSKPAAQLTSEQKEFKKFYNRGRREVEHEFSKSMRYKSIRELVAGESGLVVRDLKPVWLMSPLSVSDTLPLNTDNFDVVIFDEASQITLEEAVPSIFRAEQTIVVGDEMQLPPTSFFMSRSRDEDDEFTFEENGELVQYDLDSNSFLKHAARNLQWCLLGWHYRSQSESLISFSNHAFYDARLLTVPDVHLPKHECEELLVESPEDADRFTDEIFERAVSFHFLQNGIYEKRRNSPEAEYIAGLVRQILAREEGHSIGIVAFSEAQQGEIESALNALADEDAEFSRRLELELEREEDDQFVGLLVKNLENIQGDERDIIIMSVCYGPTREGKIRMNFGPINISGGEKRLNVAFSRARCHMALVSSMRSSSITNDFNDGANCLKNYLKYAEAASVGDQESMELVLKSLSEQQSQRDSGKAASDAVVQQLTQELERRGFRVDRNVGQSHFRCDLAITLPEDRGYRLGILVDTNDWYAQRDLLERELLKPELLAAFGWRIHVVLARDWYEDRAGILDQIELLLSGKEFEESDDDDIGLTDESEDIEEAETESEEAHSQETGTPQTNTSDTEERSNEKSNSDELAWSEYLVFVGGGSSKFWEITVSGNEHTVRFGRMGTRGQTLSKSFKDAETALADAQRQARGKRAKGYRPAE